MPTIVIPIGLDPVAISLGGFEIRWYGIFVALAVITALLLARASARRAGLPVALVDDAALWVGLAALAGGRMLSSPRTSSRRSPRTRCMRSRSGTLACPSMAD